MTGGGGTHDRFAEQGVSKATARATRCPGAVYKDPEFYELEVRHIMLKAWHYVGHQSMVPERGDYFLFEIAGESVIVVRDGEGGINAILNVCRHRGSRICDATTGRESRFTCRYHGWTYGLDGSLKAAARMPAGTRPLEARAAAPARARVRGPHLRQLRRRPAGLRRARARPRSRAAALRPRQGAGRAPAELPDPEQLEARRRELLRVLPLPAGAPRVFRRPRPRAAGRGMRRDAIGGDGARTRRSGSRST